MEQNFTEREALKASLMSVSNDEELAERLLVFMGLPKPKVSETVIKRKKGILKSLWEKMKT